MSARDSRAVHDLVSQFEARLSTASVDLQSKQRASAKATISNPSSPHNPSNSTKTQQQQQQRTISAVSRPTTIVQTNAQETNHATRSTAAIRASRVASVYEPVRIESASPPKSSPIDARSLPSETFEPGMSTSSHNPRKLEIANPSSPSNASQLGRSDGSVVKKFFKIFWSSEEENPEPEIGLPYSVIHENHVTFDHETGIFQGLPPGWEDLLSSSGISKNEIRSDPTSVLNAIRFHDEYHNAPVDRTASRLVDSICIVADVNIDQIPLSDLVRHESPASLFKIDAKLGEGASGSVFSASSLKNGDKVALKKIDMTLNANDKLIKAEIYNMQRLKHENILKYINSYMTGKEIWIIVELMDGGALMDVVTGTYRMSETQIAHVTKKVRCILET
eukprot:TRINITY_DN3009_c0_g1_i2.p1 TRINITY_DN3009_c0_g1~~TRINITY_DN3009_c0_g1_i2.p1  ORF type:complete len:392 (-),score=94.89 TRINITY_DN3009_c0_g1_i2:118-1293(-)